MSLNHVPHVKPIGSYMDAIFGWQTDWKGSLDRSFIALPHTTGFVYAGAWKAWGHEFHARYSDYF